MTSFAAHGTARPRFAALASIAFFGVLPLLALVIMFVDAIRIDGVAFDFRVFYVAAEAVLRGNSVFPPVDDPTLLDGRAYVYPPFLAVLLAPLTAVSMDTAGLIVMVALVLAALAVPVVVGVRDWRCVGIVLLWPPVISAIQTGSISIPLALAAALVWRFRRKPVRAGVALGAALAAKLLLWPIALWLAATRRWSAVAWAAACSAVLVLGSWAVVGFDGLAEYPGLLQRLSRVMDDRGYTVYALAREFDVPSQVARALWVGVALGLLACVVLVVRRGNEAAGFVLAIAASLACTPVVWLHYFSLLLVVVAVAQPRLGLAWFVPLGLVLTPGSGNPTPFQTTWTVLVAAATLAVAYRETRRSSERVVTGLPVPARTPVHAA
jgi:hypothetical protein